MTSSVVREWEDAGAQLTSALSRYLSSCRSLESLSGRVPNADIQKLASDIDDAIGSLRSHAFEQLGHSCASLVRTRNQLTTTIYSLKPEILVMIFRLVVDDNREVQPLKEGIRTVYRRLHALISVCSVWRKVGLEHGALWSLIPIICGGPRELDCAAHLSLRRATGSGLHLAADLDWTLPTPAIITALTEHAARFRTLNIRSGSLGAIMGVLAPWLGLEVPGSATELSICLVPDPPHPRSMEFASTDYLYLRQPKEWKLLNNFIMSLSTLRISGALIHPGNGSFDRLTHLRVENLQFCSTGELRPVLANLSSMPALRVLEIISVVTSPPFIDTYDSDFDAQTDGLSVSLPSLQALYLEDMPMDALALILDSIIPRSYQLTLYLDDRNWGDHDPGFDEDTLLSLLEGINVTTLMIYLWPHGFRSLDITRLLLACPTVDSLYINRLYISALGPLTRPLDNNDTFPTLRELHVGQAVMTRNVSLETFKNMVSSHPIAHLTLGGILHSSEAGREDIYGGNAVTLDKAHEVVTWLRSVVPGFRLIDFADGLPELDFRRRGMWQLW